MKERNFNGIKLFLFDMDGTLYIGDRLFPFTKRLLSAIREAGKQYLFITNNSSKSVSAYVEKLQRLGIRAAADDFLTSSQATAWYLKKQYPNKRLYVCGTASLKTEFAENGFVITENTEKAEYGSVPDCGSLCDMLYNATGKRPYVIGKPSPLMIQLAMEKRHCTPEETAVVGDRIYTDIKSGLNAGALSVLVMSGETTPEILKKSADQPDTVLESAEELLAWL